MLGAHEVTHGMNRKRAPQFGLRMDLAAAPQIVDSGPEGSASNFQSLGSTENKLEALGTIDQYFVAGRRMFDYHCSGAQPLACFEPAARAHMHSDTRAAPSPTVPSVSLTHPFLHLLVYLSKPSGRKLPNMYQATEATKVALRRTLAR